ncbi:hypothetical protein LTR41_012005 [Exophiala xenobiotica]|nr:hypothetical protein LTR41_012005 [Exophiala xenobiotica]KAK5550162.1 hypothetical protein LTR46_011839 [Exophiala xenobiotica]
MQEDPQPDNAAVKGQDLVDVILSKWDCLVGALKRIWNPAGGSTYAQTGDNPPQTQCHREPAGTTASAPFSREKDLPKQAEWQFGNEQGDRLARILEEIAQDTEKSFVVQGLTELFGPTIELQLLNNQIISRASRYSSWLVPVINWGESDEKLAKSGVV